MRKAKKITKFPFSRTVGAKVYTIGDKCYVKTKEIAILLGIKQPFEFARHIKKALDEETVLSLKRAEFIYQDEREEFKSTFIEVKDMIKYLRRKNIPEAKTPYMERVIEALENVNEKNEERISS